MEVRIPSTITDVRPTEDNNDDDDDFEVYSSSDEEGPDGKKKEWEPAPERIIELYNKIANGEIPELQWKCPGRREPSVEGDYEEDIEETDNTEESSEKPTEFDFDSMFSEPTEPFGQRKTPGTLKVQQKRVARLDKILNDMKKDTSVFQLQSPRIPFQQGRSDSLPPPSYGVQTTPLKPDSSGIPLPSAYMLTSPQVPESLTNVPGTPVSVTKTDKSESGDTSENPS